MPQPKDYDEPGQKIILREIVKESTSNGGFTKLKDAVFLAIVLAIGAIIWDVSQRQTRIEIWMKIIAKQIGINLE